MSSCTAAGQPSRASIVCESMLTLANASEDMSVSTWLEACTLIIVGLCLQDGTEEFEHRHMTPSR